MQPPSSRSWRISLRQAALFVVPLALAGCGGGTGTVSGKVTLDGSPLPAGRIVFFGPKGKSATAEIKDGQYTASNVPAGDVKITVDTKYLQTEGKSLTNASEKQPDVPVGNPEAMPEAARAKFEAEQKKIKENFERGKKMLEAYKEIPSKYSKAETSGFTMTLKKGESATFEAALKSDK
jgi:hypothetical protein